MVFLLPQVLRVVSLPHPGSDLVVSNAGAASLNIYAALHKAVKLMGLLLDRHDVLTPPPVPVGPASSRCRHSISPGAVMNPPLLCACLFTLRLTL
jgi:hypothetical protein